MYWPRSRRPERPWVLAFRGPRRRAADPGATGGCPPVIKTRGAPAAPGGNPRVIENAGGAPAAPGGKRRARTCPSAA